MANMTFGVNLIPKNSDNTQQTLGNSENKWNIYADNLTATTINSKTPVSGVKGNSESSYRTGDVNITAANIGLGNVENKSSATIRGELTKANVTTALGYTPPTAQRGIQDNLTSTSTTDSLSANQGKVLKGLVDGKAASGHTHTTSIATSTGTNQITLAANTKYAITAGDTSYIFTTPSDTNTWRPISDSVSSTSSSDAASSKAVKTAYDLAASKTANTGTVTSVATGVGLTGGTISGSGTLKAKLRSESALSYDSAAATTTSGRVYPVAVDKTGYLAVNVPWANTTYSAGTGLSLSGTTFSNSGATGVKGNSESSYRTGDVNITAANIGLGNVENKSSATIRGELTKANVTDALGYTPYKIIADSSPRTIVEGTNNYDVSHLSADYIVAAWQFSTGYSENNPPADIAITTKAGYYVLYAANILVDGVTIQPVFIKPN